MPTNTEQQKRLDLDINVFAAWQDGPANWRDAISAVAQQAWEQTRRTLPAQGQLAQACKEIMAKDRPLGQALEEAAFEVAVTAAALGGVFGYALARTWPAGIDGLGEWPAVAWRFAGLDDWIAAWQDLEREISETGGPADVT